MNKVEVEQSYYRDRVAVRYYNNLNGEQVFNIDSPSDRERARKKFTQDKKIDLTVFRKTIREIFNLQMELLK